MTRRSAALGGRDAGFMFAFPWNTTSHEETTP
jgi:hypothetical protein